MNRPSPPGTIACTHCTRRPATVAAGTPTRLRLSVVPSDSITPSAEAPVESRIDVRTTRSARSAWMTSSDSTGFPPFGVTFVRPTSAWPPSARSNVASTSVPVLASVACQVPTSQPRSSSAAAWLGTTYDSASRQVPSSSTRRLSNRVSCGGAPGLPVNRMLPRTRANGAATRSTAVTLISSVACGCRSSQPRIKATIASRPTTRVPPSMSSALPAHWSATTLKSRLL